MNADDKQTLARYQAERNSLHIRLAKVEAVIDALVDAFGEPPPRRSTTRKKKKTRKTARRKPNPVSQAPVHAEPKPGGMDAASRRHVIFTLIDKSEAGLTLADIRAKTPKMNHTERGNTLQQLKTAGTIKRVGNSWISAKPLRET